MKKRRCQLCGGKIVNGRCVECGLDNTQTDERYEVQKGRCEGQPLTHIHEENGSITTGPRRREEQKQQVKYPGQAKQMRQPKPRISSESSTKPKKGGMQVIVAVFVIVLTLAKLINRGIEEYSNHIGGSVWNVREERDPYEYVEKPLPEGGETYMTELSAGEYIVGVHIPEGQYAVRLTSGYGSMRLEDDENGIYIYEYFSDEDGGEYKTAYEDLRLYQGAKLDIDFRAKLELQSDNAQTDLMTGTENPVKTEAKISGTAAAGVDFEPGIYDVYCVTEQPEQSYGMLRCLVPGTVSEEDRKEYDLYTKTISIDGDNMECQFRNMVFPEGTELKAEGLTLKLVPSEVVGSTNYRDYYNYLDK